MFVMDITEITKSKVLVLFDDGTSIPLYKNELKLYNIVKENELSEASYREIYDKMLPKRAKLRCMSLLKSRDYTRYQLEEKLRQGKYPQEIIDEAVGYVQGYGYINDVNYGKAYISQSYGNKSLRQIEARLLAKGISREDIQTAFDEIGRESDFDSAECEAQSIKKQLDKYIMKKGVELSELSCEEKQKIMASLYRKGFSMGSIRSAINTGF